MAFEDELHSLPSGWNTTTLGHLCDEGGGDIQTGPFGSQLHSCDYVSVGIPSIMPTNISVEGIQAQGIARITLQDAERLQKYRVRDGDIIYSRRGDVEKCALVSAKEDGWLCGTGCLRIRLGQGPINNDFLHAYLSSPPVRAWIVRHSVGATMPNLNTGILRGLPIAIPPPDEMQGMGELWATLTKKTNQIGLMNQTLEGLARAIFTSWFVDFDPVRAKAEGREPEGMDAATAALFPSDFRESELGVIPTGWEVKRVKDICDRIANGGTPKRSQVLYWQNGEHSWFKTGELKDGFLFQSEETISELALQESAAKIFPRHTVLIALYGATIGKLGILAAPASFNQAATGMIASKNIGCWFLYLSLLTGRSWFINRGNGAAQQNISKEVVESYPVSVPTDSSISRSFHDLVSPMFERFELNQELIQSLSALRDTLLPRLISGKLRVPEAERLVEAVL